MVKLGDKSSRRLRLEGTMKSIVKLAGTKEKLAGTKEKPADKILNMPADKYVNIRILVETD